ncbi:MAG TPA: large conductance mechanosensitive channel protein MscL [Bryobacteraceae bacterium]|nr:large conductance mechanosensitive channel protein MscL [Bryobacteraceae bacterium]
MLKEFREFAIKGNALDLAVGVIIGAAFGAVVNSLVTDVIMPPIGMGTGGVDFKDHFIALNGQTYASLAVAKSAGAPVLAWGNFVNTVLNFLIVAFAVFLLVKQINRFRGPAEVTTKSCPYCTNAIPLKATRCPLCTSQIA